MIWRAVLSASSLLLIAACANIDTRYEILAALDTEADGYVGYFDSPPRQFTIRESYVSEAKLCRVVVISSSSHSETPTTQIESFCKAKGGKWR